MRKYIMKILILTSLILSSSLFANCNKEKSISIIEDYIHDELTHLVSGDIDYSLHLKIGKNLEIIRNETEHSYLYSEKIYSSKDGLTCQELFVKLDCSVANISITHKYLNCKN